MATDDILNLRPRLQQLESRYVLATWPIDISGGRPATLLETWGQYQEIETPGVDLNIHHHEGIDIAAPAGTVVMAVASCQIFDVAYVPRNPYQNVISVFDEGRSGKGWNYKHIIPSAAIVDWLASKIEAKKLNKVVPILKLKMGDPIGTVVEGPVVAPGVRIASHVHLDRGQGLDKQLLPKLNFIAPTLNPILEFKDILILDKAAPTITGVTYRIAADDELAPDSISTPYAGFGTSSSFGGSEKPRNTAHYFDGRVTVGDENYSDLGRRAESRSATGNKLINKKGNANIDIIVDAQDTFTGSANPLGIHQLGFDIVGDKFAQSTGFVASVDLSSQPKLVSVVQDINLAVTRSIYENDIRNNSKLHSQYFYIATNTTSDAMFAPKFGAGSTFYTKNREYFWNSDAATNKGWSATLPTDADSNAKGNYDARYPDDLYTVKVQARDASNNITDKEFKILLHNWERTVKVENVTHLAGDPIKIDGGKGYRQNDELSIYFVPYDKAVEKLKNGTKLDGFEKTSTTTDEAGEIKDNPTLTDEGLVPGKYWAVVDYNGDNEFTNELDASVTFIVKERSVDPPPPKPKVAAVADKYTVVGVIGLDIPAPGLMLNDKAPPGSGVRLLGSNPFLGGVFNFNSDGSFFLRLGDFGGTFPVVFSYALTGPSGEDGGQATVTIDRPAGALRSSVAAYSPVTIAVPNSISTPVAERIMTLSDASLAPLRPSPTVSAVSPVVAPFEQKSVASSPPVFEHVAHGASLFDDEWDFDAVSGLLLGSRRETDHAPVLRPPF